MKRRTEAVLALYGPRIIAQGKGRKATAALGQRNMRAAPLPRHPDRSSLDTLASRGRGGSGGFNSFREAIPPHRVSRTRRGSGLTKHTTTIIRAPFLNPRISRDLTGWLEISHRTELPCCAPILRRTRFGLLRTVVAADGGLTASDLYLNSTILDFPVAHRAFLRLHDIPPGFELTIRVTATLSDAHEDMVTR